MVKSESKTKKCQLMYNSKGRKKERKKKKSSLCILLIGLRKGNEGRKLGRRGGKYSKTLSKEAREAGEKSNMNVEQRL